MPFGGFNYLHQYSCICTLTIAQSAFFFILWMEQFAYLIYFTKIRLKKHHFEGLLAWFLMSYCQWKSGYCNLSTYDGWRRWKVDINKIRFEALGDHYDHYGHVRYLFLFFIFSLQILKLFTLLNTNQNHPNSVNTLYPAQSWIHMRKDHLGSKFSCAQIWERGCWGLKS